METKNFDIKVPPELIAQVPCEPRDSSRLLVIDRRAKKVWNAGFFRSLPDFLPEGDVLIYNNSRVIPARLEGHKESSPMERITLLLLRKETIGWQVLVEAGALTVGETVVLTPPQLKFKVVKIGEKIGKREECVVYGTFSDDSLLEKGGKPPVPPYIHGYTGDSEKYQTVYSLVKGSAACPTAGLHFTEELLTSLSRQGVILIPVTLHVGIDTFMPIQEEEVERHAIYTEYFEVAERVYTTVEEARKRGNKITCVGTTAVRVVETIFPRSESSPVYSGWTDKYIYPGYKFKVVDQLITNFHYPKSSNLVLVSAFAGTELIRKAYKEAVKSKYRFYSFGDACLIL